MSKIDTVALDKQIGVRVRELRLTKGLSQQQLGEKLGITYQQIQKYEKGKSRISSSTLFQISQILEVPVLYFFQDLGIQSFSGSAVRLTPQIVQLVKDYESLPDERKKGFLKFLQVIKKM